MSSVSSVSSDDESIKKIGQIFADSPILHGQIFDDGRRWCGTCNRPMLVCKTTAEAPWNNMICAVCTSIWPEFESYIQDQMDDMVEIDLTDTE